LIDKRVRLGRLIQTLDGSLQRLERNEQMNHHDMFSGFDRDRIEEQITRYHDEAVELYGEETVEASEERARSLTPEDWKRIEQETAQINQQMASLMDTHAPDSAEAQNQIERWFTLLNRYFSEYTPEVFAGLGDLYVEDERFTAHYDQVRSGLAQFFRDSMHAFAARRQSDE
jgi:MerR family transcriptional regulator, multidrug-efflux activator